MDVILKSGLVLVLILAGGWLFIEVGSRWYANRPYKLDSDRVDQYLRGLIRWCKSGAYVSLTDPASRDRMRFTKREGSDSVPDFIELRLTSSRLNEQAIQRIATALDALAPGLCCELLERCIPDVILRLELRGDSVQSALKLVAVARVVARELGHSHQHRYRVEYEGPADSDKFITTYGLRQ